MDKLRLTKLELHQLDKLRLTKLELH